MTPAYDDPSTDEKFYARALAILVGPSRRMALAMRACNLAYWVSVMAALGWLAAQAIDRQPPVVVHAAELLTPRLRPGEPVRVAYTLTRLKTCATDLNWAIYDGAGEIHSFGPVHVEATGPPGRETYTRAWTTPTEAAPGVGRLRVILAFQCPGNYLQALYPVTLVLPDLPIRIDPSG
jgi:hypothetical protein